MKKLLLTKSLLLTLPSLTISLTSCFITKPNKQTSTEENNVENINESKCSLIKTDISFKDVAGYSAEKNELNKAIDIIKNPKKYSENNVFPPKGILFEGQPGTGKSLLAKAFAGQADLYYFFLSGSEFDNKYVGVGADNVRKIFAQARSIKEPCAIIIDEIDSIARKRGDIGSGRDHTSPQTLNQLLKELTDDANKNIILIGTTNLISELDPALIRTGRFDIKLSFKATSQEERKEIFEFYINKTKKIQKAKLNLDYLTEISSNMVGSDIKLIVDNVATKIIQTNSSDNIIQMFEEEIETQKFGLQSNITRKDNELKKTAYLQCAAALVAIKTNCCKVNKISIIPRGKKFGFISFVEEYKNKTVKQIKDKIKFLLAGIAYETLGSNNSDNMSEEETDNWQNAQKLTAKLDYDFLLNPSDNIIENCLNDAKTIIKNNKAKLDALADALFKQKSLSKDEILKLVK